MAAVEMDELGIWAENTDLFLPVFKSKIISNSDGDEYTASVRAVNLTAGRIKTVGVASCIAFGCRTDGMAFLAHVGASESLEVFAPAVEAFIAASPSCEREWYLYNGFIFDDILLPAVQKFISQYNIGSYRFEAVDAGCGDFEFDVQTGEPFPPANPMVFTRTIEGGGIYIRPK